LSPLYSHPPSIDTLLPSPFFLSNYTAPPNISPLSLHDALPISLWPISASPMRPSRPGYRQAPPIHRRRSHRLQLRSRRPHRLRRSEEHTSELQSLTNLVCRLLLEKKN